MLTIKNIGKIIGAPIYKEWYVKSMQGMMRVTDTNGTHSELYQIIIRNGITGSEGRVYLNREFANVSIKRWYELYCEIGTKRKVQLITKDTIKDIKELLEHIKIVAID